MSKKNNNHFVSVGLAENFRVCGSNMWKLNCKTGEITDRHTGPGKLFMGKRLWSREVEDSYMQLENRLLPLIKQILNAPYADIPSNYTGQVVALSKNYLPIFGYIMQSAMLQRAKTPESKGKDEKIFSDMLSANINAPTDTVFLIRYNPKQFEKTPLLLIDNCFVMVPTPPTSNEKLEYSVAYLLPISPFNCLVWGTEAQVDYLIHFLRTPDEINQYKIMQEDKECEVASHSLEYLEKLKKGLPALKHWSKRIQVTSERKYPLTEEKKDGQAENADAEQG